MSEKLKPCPFCGENKLTVTRYFGLNCYTVRCINEDCGMKVVTDFAKTKKEAIEAWNKRANPEIVRCKDCLYFYDETNMCGLFGSWTDADGFCHKAEKKETN